MERWTRCDLHVAGTTGEGERRDRADREEVAEKLVPFGSVNPLRERPWMNSGAAQKNWG